jgi:dynein intermediate chain
LDPRTLAAIYSDAEFNEFLESSSKIIQRALSDGYDYLKDYSMNFGDEDGM